MAQARSASARITSITLPLQAKAHMASVTITTTGAQDTRLGPAFGALLGLSGNANASQVKAYLIDHMRTIVQNYEREQARKALSEPAAFDPT